MNTYEEFVMEYGYDDQPLQDHDGVMRIYLNCKEQRDGLQRIFTPEQLEQLAEIN